MNISGSLYEYIARVPQLRNEFHLQPNSCFVGILDWMRNVTLNHGKRRWVTTCIIIPRLQLQMTLWSWINRQFFYGVCSLCINSSSALQSQNSTNHMVHCIVVNCHKNMRLWGVKGSKYRATLVAVYFLLPSSRTSHVHFLLCRSIVTQKELAWPQEELENRLQEHAAKWEASGISGPA